MQLNAQIFEANERNFEQAVLSRARQTPVLVDFWAPWCAPCRNLTPLLEDIVKDYGGRLFLAKINTDENANLAMQCGVQSLPTVLLFSQGRIIDGFVGLQPAGQIRDLLRRHLGEPEAPAIADPLPPEHGDIPAAIADLQSRLAAAPDDVKLPPQLARLLLLAHRYDEAAAVLERLTAEQKADREVMPLLATLRLAHCLREAQLAERPTTNPAGAEAAYLSGLHQALAGDHAAALEALLESVRTDRKLRDGAARKAMLDIFAILGGGPVVKEFRSRLYSLLN